jgi:hypothetical protein
LNLFSRIVLALDLELWFLFSLRFVSAIKLLGPKLIMIRNMVSQKMKLLTYSLKCLKKYYIIEQIKIYNQIIWLIFSDVLFVLVTRYDRFHLYHFCVYCRLWYCITVPNNVYKHWTQFEKFVGCYSISTLLVSIFDCRRWKKRFR